MPPSTATSSRSAPRKLAVPPTESALAANQQAIAFIEAKQRDTQDPAFADAFVQSLSRLAAAVRTALHAG